MSTAESKKPTATVLLLRRGSTGALGHPRADGESDASSARVRARLARVPRIRRVVDVHADGLMPRPARRRWAGDNWRGGLRGAPVWDELMPAAPLLAALDGAAGKVDDTDPLLLLADDWPLVCPDLIDRLLDAHAAAPDTMKMAFAQAPPGLGPLLMTPPLLRDLADEDGGLTPLFAYVIKRPRLDVISRPHCVAVDADVRNTARRFIADTPAARARTAHLLDVLPPDADAAAVCAATRAWEAEAPHAGTLGVLPDVVGLELTRALPPACDGPSIPRPEVQPMVMPLDRVEALAPQLAGRALLLGGLGDPLLHRDWPQVIAHLRAHARGIALDTFAVPDGEAPEVLAERLAKALGPDDAVAVRLHADTPEVYRAAVCPALDAAAADARYTAVRGVLKHLMQLSRRGLGPAVIVRMTKTPETLPDLEACFTRFWQVADHAVLDRFPTGGFGDAALLPDRNPLPMEPPLHASAADTATAPPPRAAHPTVHADGTFTLCAHDWQARAPLGRVSASPLADLWRDAAAAAAASSWTPSNTPMCRPCARLWAQLGNA